MPNYGVELDDEADRYVQHGLGTAPGKTLNRSERIRELVKTGGAVEEALRGTGFPRRGRPLDECRGDIAMVIEQGVTRCEELGLL